MLANFIKLDYCDTMPLGRETEGLGMHPIHKVLLEEDGGGGKERPSLNEVK